MSIKLSDDIYEISETINEIQKNFIEEETEETLAVGMYGYLADIQSLQIQNSIILGAELGNELFPSRAKFEKNILAHSIIQNITDINAVPAKIDILIGIEEDILNNLFISNKCVIDASYPIYIENFEFHLPYNLIITKSITVNEEVVYSARYDTSRENELSDITNPYITTPFIQLLNTKRYVYLNCRLLQVQQTTEYKKLLTSSAIENKTFEFSITDQLAAFEVKVIEGDDVTWLKPIFEGVGIDNDTNKYCFYTFISTNTIRIRFDSISYMPKINAKIEVYVNTTKGATGNFEYNTSFFTTLSSDTYNYKNLNVVIVPVSNSEDGLDRKTTDELRRLLPKEALSRGSITNMQDLENYFTVVNTIDNILVPRKKVDNQFERTYYAYLLLKDQYSNVIPINTINLEIPLDKFETHGNRKYVIKQGCGIEYDGEVGRVIDVDNDFIDDDKLRYVYTPPFMVVVNADPLYVSYYISLMDSISYLDFTYINQEAVLQFISTNLSWKRSYITERDTYILTTKISQNINSDQGLIKYDEEGNIIEENLKVIAVLYNSDSESPYRYQYGTLCNPELEDTETTIVDGVIKQNGAIFKYEFRFTTDDILSDDNKIKINNVYVPGLEEEAIDYGYFTGNVKVRLYVLAKLPEGQNFGLYDLDSIVPAKALDGFTVCNMYTVIGGLNFYTNYTHLMNSAIEDISIKGDYGILSKGFRIKSVPVLRYSYSLMEDQMMQFIREIEKKKSYIDDALDHIENNFEIDFKFFNTYGPSKIYTLDEKGEQLVDRVNLTLNFELKLLKTADILTKDYIIKDLKDIIEDLNTMDSLHIPNIITTITNTYRNSIEYFEFLGFNDYGPGVQHLYRNETEDVSIVPEFLTIHTMTDLTPDINIILA